MPITMCRAAAQQRVEVAVAGKKQGKHLVIAPLGAIYVDRYLCIVGE